MSPRADVSTLRRAQILDAATEVFVRKGFDDASMSDVVAEAGLSKGALYWYFKSKDQIITALLDRIFVSELEQLEALAQKEGPARERLLEFARITARQMKRMSSMLPIAYEFYSLAFRNKTVKKALEKYLIEYYSNLVPIIEQGVARGEFRPVNAQEIAVALGAAVEGTYLLWVFQPKLVLLESQLELNFKLILDGLAVLPEQERSGLQYVE